MSREVRCVPADWQHPTDADGEFIPLFGERFSDALAEWEEENRQWDLGLVRDYATGTWEPKEGYQVSMSYEDWGGERPEPADYFPRCGSTDGTS